MQLSIGVAEVKPVNYIIDIIMAILYNIMIVRVSNYSSDYACTVHLSQHHCMCQSSLTYDSYHSNGVRCASIIK